MILTNPLLSFHHRHYWLIVQSSYDLVYEEEGEVYSQKFIDDKEISIWLKKLRQIDTLDKNASNPIQSNPIKSNLIEYNTTQ